MNKTTTHKIQDRIKTLERQINDLKARWPAHSIPAALMEQLDELEEALADEISKLGSHGLTQD